MTSFPWNTTPNPAKASFQDQTALFSLPSSYFVFEFLSNSNGFGVNSVRTDMAVDPTSANFGDNAAVHFFDFEVVSGFHFKPGRINIVMRANTMFPSNFGDLGALDNGIIFDVTGTDGSTVELNFIGSEAIHFNYEWGLWAGVDVNIKDAVGGNNDAGMTVRWTFTKTGAQMDLKAGQKIRLTHQDSLGVITSLQAQIQGYLLPI